MTQLRERAAAVLHGNTVLLGKNMGAWTKAAPRLYPHQWNWDTAFIAIGWAHLDVRRAMTELEGLSARSGRRGWCRTSCSGQGRDPEESGLVTTYHPWEGTDNSPR